MLRQGHTTSCARSPSRRPSTVAAPSCLRIADHFIVSCLCSRASGALFLRMAGPMGWLAATGMWRLLPAHGDGLLRLAHSAAGWAAPTADICANATYEHRLDNPDEYNFCRQAWMSSSGMPAVGDEETHSAIQHRPLCSGCPQLEYRLHARRPAPFPRRCFSRCLACLAAARTPSSLPHWRCWWPAVCTSPRCRRCGCWWRARWQRVWSFPSTWAGGEVLGLGERGRPGQRTGQWHQAALGLGATSCSAI